MPDTFTDAEVGIEPELTDADVGLGFDESKIKLSPYDRATMDRGGVKPPSGMESGTELTTALAGGALRASAVVPPTIRAIADFPTTVSRGVAMGQGHYADMPPIGEERAAQSEGFGAAMQKPFVSLDLLKAKAHPNDPAWSAAIKEAESMLVSIPEFIESPLGVLTMGTGLGGKAATNLARYAFAGDMVKSMFDQVPQLRDNWGTMSAADKGKAITQFIGTGAMAGLLAHPEVRGTVKDPLANVADRTGQLAPDAIRPAPGGRPVMGAENKPLPTGFVSPSIGMAPAPSTAQLPPPAQRDLSAQGQIDAMMREGKGPAPSAATPPTDLARTAPAPGTGLTPEGRGRPFDPRFPEAPVPASAPADTVPVTPPPKPTAPAGASVVPDPAVVSKLGLKFDGTQPGAAIKMPTPEQLAKMSPEERKMYADIAAQQGDQWAFTPQPGSAIPGRTFYVRKGATPGEIRAAYEKKVAQEQFAQQAAVAPPAPSPDTVRVYSGSGGTAGAGQGGSWFTENPQRAASFGPDVTFVDVPKAVADAARQGIKTDYVLPDEWVRKAKPFKVEQTVHEIDEPAAPPEPSAAPAPSPFKAGDQVDHQGQTKTIKRMSPDGKFAVIGNRAILISEIKPIEKPAAPPPPASSVGLSAPVDVTQPPKAKKPYNMASLRAPADEFKRLVEEHGVEHGWISEADLEKIAPELKGLKRGHSSASMAATVAMNKVLKPAYLKALEDLGIKTDNNTLKLHAEALPKLKALLEKHAQMVPIPLAQMPDGSKFTRLGEEHTVTGTNQKTGIVTIKDGIPIKVHMDDSVKIDPGSLKTPEVSAPTPKLRPGEKGTAELLQGSEAPFNLAGEVQSDPARIAAESKAKADSAAAAKAIAAKQQPDLFGQPPSASAQLVNPPDVTLELGAGIPIPRFLDEAATKAAEYVREIFREEFNAPKMNDRRRAVLNWSAKLQRSFGEASAKQRDILKRVPNAIHRDGITNWIQADGDAATLAQRRADTASWRDPATGKPHPDAKRLIAGYDAALRLTPEEIAIANQVKGDYARFAARGQAANVLNTLKDDYVTQTWDLKRGPGGTGSGRTLKEKFRFSRASTFANYFEGEQAGYSPKTKDISKLLPMYSHEMNAVIAARQMVAEMGRGVASDGRPLLAPKGIGIPVDDPVNGEATLVLPKVGSKETSDYKVLANQPALSGWKWVSKDSAGNPVMLKADLALHPEAFNHLRAILGRSAIREWYSNRSTALAEIPKGIVHGIDWANSETKRTMLGMLATFHQIQTGTHAVGHRVNPFFSIPKVDLVGNPHQMDAARHGLMMFPDRASENQFMEGFRTSGLVSHLPGIGPISDWYSHYLFSEYIPGLKFKTYQAILDRNLKVYDRQIASGRVSGADVKVLSAEQANAAYGHLNYADLGRNPTLSHIAQLGLLAPDFLEARGRFVGQAIKGITGVKVGREQLLALATLAMAQATLAYTSAKITGGEWDKQRPFEFTLGNRRFTMRSVPEDLQNLVTKTRQFVNARLSPIIGKGTLQYATGVDYRGRKISANQTTKELAYQPVPLSIRGFLGLGQSTLSGLEQLAGTIGLRISRYSPMMDMHDLVVDYKKSSNDPKLQAAIALQEQEVFASPYEKLRSVLHSGNLETARKEYDKLSGVRTPKQIDNAMKPWTGGNISGLKVSPQRPKPFTGSAASEQAFVKSLTPEQLQTYQKAVAERAMFYQKFKEMLRTTKKTERELTDAEVGITP